MVMVLASATAYGTTPILAKFAYGVGLGPQQILAVRFLFAATGMVMLSSATGTNLLRFGARRAATIGAMGAVLYTAQGLTFFLALRSLPASLVALISFTYPTMVVLFGWTFMGRSILPMHALALIASIVGVGLLLGGIRIQLGWGLLFAIANPFVYTAYLLIGEKVMDKGQALATSSIIIAGAAIGFCVIAGLTGELRPPPSAQGWAITVTMALVPTMLGISLLLGALPRIGAARAAVLSTWEPVVTVALAAVLLAERLSLVQLLGALVLLAAVATLQFGQTAPVAVVEH
jgi:drug/metabolite transporter (DMT)-like permease